jgi:serine/threonine-protein kinase
LLGSDQQKLMAGLQPEGLAGRVSWGLSQAQVYRFRGDSVRARVYADSARIAAEAALDGATSFAPLLAQRGLSLAYLGRSEEARREGERATALRPISADAHWGAYLQDQLARIYIVVGEYERALDTLEPLLNMPYFLTPGWLRIDPTFAPLRGHPRFERLVRGTPPS